MTERFIHHVKTELPPDTETATEARVRLAEKFPRNSLRRMTHLGMLLGASLEGATLRTEDAIVYLTSYAETRALEDFLKSFPLASPLLFQTSIHPGGIEQVLIAKQQPIARLWPLASNERAVEQGLQTALLEPAETCWLLGGEERGTWLLDAKMASARSFAFALGLSKQADGAVGKIAFSPAPAADEPVPALSQFAEALAARQALSWRSEAGEWSVSWR